MRSRNGNRPYLLAVCAIVSLPLWAADEYFIGYRAVVDDALLVNESLTVSRAMSPCEGSPAFSVELDAKGSTDLKRIILDNYDDFWPFMQREALHIRHRESHTGFSGGGRSVLALSPRCYTVDFNEDFVKISALK